MTFYCVRCYREVKRSRTLNGLCVECRQVKGALRAAREHAKLVYKIKAVRRKQRRIEHG